MQNILKNDMRLIMPVPQKNEKSYDYHKIANVEKFKKSMDESMFYDSNRASQ